MPPTLPETSLPDPAPQLDRDAVLREVARGLPNEGDRLRDAFANMAFAELEGDKFVRRREAETDDDYEARPKLVTGLVHQVLGRLTSHSYNPGPHRSAGDAGLDRLLQQTYEQNHVDALMHEADRLSTLNDVAAIQVRWTGDRKPERPIDLMLWGAEEFAVFESDDDPREPGAVVTMDRRDNRTRYRVWFPDAVHTFRTAKSGGDDGRRTEGAVVAFEEAGSPRPNPYGAIPFVFVHYTAPVRQFWTAGSPGNFLRKAEATVNQQLSDLAEGIGEYSLPVRWFKNVGPEFNPEIGVGRFLRLVRGGPTYSGDGFSDPGDPEAGHLQAELAIEAIWQHLRNTLDQVAEACGLPASALRLDYTDAPSGFAIVAHAFPLFERARQRRPLFQRAETELARMVCRIYGAMAGDAAIAAAAPAAKVLMAWPEPRIPIPGPDRDETDAWEIQLGAKSRIQVIEERYNLSRDQAVEHLRRVAEEEALAAEILPQPEEPPTPGPGPQQQQQQGDPADDPDPDDDEE